MDDRIAICNRDVICLEDEELPIVRMSRLNQMATDIVTLSMSLTEEFLDDRMKLCSLAKRFLDEHQDLRKEILNRQINS